MNARQLLLTGISIGHKAIIYMLGTLPIVWAASFCYRDLKKKTERYIAKP